METDDIMGEIRNQELFKVFYVFTLNLISEKQDAEYWEQLNNERLEVFQHKRKRNKHGRGRQKV